MLLKASCSWLCKLFWKRYQSLYRTGEIKLAHCPFCDAVLWMLLWTVQLSRVAIMASIAFQVMGQSQWTSVKYVMDTYQALLSCIRERTIFSRFLLQQYTNINSLHVQVWMTFAQFELSVPVGDTIARSRAVYSEAHKSLKSAEEKEERLMLLEAWKDFEVCTSPSSGIFYHLSFLPSAIVVSHLLLLYVQNIDISFFW